MNKHNFLWLDLETTGLDPRAGHILEWAAVLAADDRDGDMSPIAQYSGVIRAKIEPLSEKSHDYTHKIVLAGDERDVIEIDPFVLAMHTRNDLWKDCEGSDTSLADSEEFLVQLCVELAGVPEPKGIVLAGASVHLDLSWIREHMPRLAKCLSHRVFDVSTLKLANQSWGGVPFAKAEAHRALPDILESLEQAAAVKRSVAQWAQGAA